MENLKVLAVRGNDVSNSQFDKGIKYCAAFVIEKNNSINPAILHIQRHDGKISAPGGTIDNKEASFINEACREFYEEVGTKLPPGSAVLAAYQWNSTTAVFVFDAPIINVESKVIKGSRINDNIHPIPDGEATELIHVKMLDLVNSNPDVISRYRQNVLDCAVAIVKDLADKWEIIANMWDRESFLNAHK